jgi:3-methyl-2-oxobutanoate hydroxymethyltransferase
MAVTLPSLRAMRAAGQKIAMLTCYDASFAALMDRCGVEILLIGDSLGMVCAGYDSTLPVTVADVAYHTASVVRGRKNALVLADLPFGSYGTKEQAYDSCATLMRAGAQMIKIEGGAWLAETVHFLVERAIVLLEAVPAALGKEVTELLHVPTIGIGAGPDCSGQVLVMHDLLGVFPGRKARFVKNFMDGQTSIDAAVGAYVTAVKDGSFPAPEHCF